MGGTTKRVLEPFAANSYTTDLVAVPMYVNTASDRLIGWYIVQSPTVCESTTSPPQPQPLAGRLVDAEASLVQMCSFPFEAILSCPLPSLITQVLNLVRKR